MQYVSFVKEFEVARIISDFVLNIHGLNVCERVSAQIKNLYSTAGS